MEIVACALAYLGGSIPVGLLVGRWVKGIDVRTQGSGNIGTTNVLRVIGPVWAAITFILDAAKGFLPVYLGLRSGFGPTALAFLALFAVVGHNWSLFLGFRGGKGVATSIGALLALGPVAALATVVLWLLTVGISGYASLGSLLGLAAAGPALLISHAPGAYPVLGLGLFVIALWRHKANVKRLIEGKELAILPRRRASAAKP